jgi:hypothetical protein
MFPIEQYFERKFEKKKGALYNFFNICGKCESSIKDKIKQKTSKVRPTAAEIKKQESELWIRHSVSMSCVVLIGILLLLSAFFGTLSAGYLSRVLCLHAANLIFIISCCLKNKKDHLGTTNNGAQAVGFSSQNVLPVVNSTIRQSHATLLL